MSPSLSLVREWRRRSRLSGHLSTTDKVEQNFIVWSKSAHDEMPCDTRLRAYVELLLVL